MLVGRLGVSPMREVRAKERSAGARVRETFVRPSDEISSRLSRLSRRLTASSSIAFAWDPWLAFWAWQTLLRRGGRLGGGRCPPRVRHAGFGSPRSFAPATTPQGAQLRPTRFRGGRVTSTPAPAPTSSQKKTRAMGSSAQVWMKRSG